RQHPVIPTSLGEIRNLIAARSWLNISHQATALGEQILNHTRPSLFRMTRNITERATPRHSDEPKRDQESNGHTLSLNISHQVTALGEQILNHARPSLFRMTRNITERTTPRHSDEPRRDQESNCHTLLAQYFTSNANYPIESKNKGRRSALFCTY
ncbi:hypothetical protein, partial [Vibrio rotiferianus]|uniref:hypothetical protein n=1 Tax=Vibrio rotiferianus TaxID=190895 RepID=UPI001B80C3DD